MGETRIISLMDAAKIADSSYPTALRLARNGEPALHIVDLGLHIRPGTYIPSSFAESRRWRTSSGSFRFTFASFSMLAMRRMNEVRWMKSSAAA